MMPKERLNIIRTEIRRVIQDATFMLAEPATDQDIAEGLPVEPHWARIAYNGSAEGNVYIGAGDELARTIAGNMLGTYGYDILPPERVVDSFKELANIITGRMILLLYGRQALFRLSVPIYFRACPFEFNNMPDNVLMYNCEGMILNVILTVKEGDSFDKDKSIDS